MTQSSTTSAKLALYLLAAPCLTTLSMGVTAHAQYKVPATTCNSPAGSIAADPSTPSQWQGTKVDDPSAFLVHMAVEGGCFTRASSPSTAQFKIISGPISKQDYEARQGGGTSGSSDPGDLLNSLGPKMAYAYTEIRDASGRSIVRGVGENNRTSLDFSGWSTANQGVVSFMESGKSERRSGGAMYNAFDEIQAAVDGGRVRAGGAVASSGYGGSQPTYSGGSGASGGGAVAQSPNTGGGQPGVTVKQAMEGKDNSIAFADKFRAGQSLTIRGYTGYVQETKVSVGRCNPKAGDARCAGFNLVEPAVTFNVMSRSSKNPVGENAVTCIVANGRETMKGYAIGDPIVVTGTFFSESRFGLPEISSQDCQVQGSWSPGSATDRRARGGAASTESFASLIRQADGNSFGFFQKYGGKRVAVLGPVSDISEGNNGMIDIKMNDRSLGVDQYGYGLGGEYITCSVPPSQGAKAGQLSKGRTATVVGTITKASGSSSGIFGLQDCEIR